MHVGPDLVVQGAPFEVFGPLQRNDVERKARPLQAEKLLRDEGFRRLRVAIQDDGDLSATHPFLQLD
jgi:hypothetical protein